jgi:Spy/CpxP family protein refolding chaperone
MALHPDLTAKLQSATEPCEALVSAEQHRTARNPHRLSFPINHQPKKQIIMMRIALLPALVAALLTTSLPLQSAPAKDSPPDPLAGAFFPPDLVMLAGERIGLTSEQRDRLRARVEKDQPHFEELRQRLERESTALAALAKKERVDEAALIAQLDKLLDAEREVKHAHVGLLAAVKNLLTQEQQAKLSELGKGGMEKFADETRQRIEGKVAQVQEHMQKWAEGGRDPSEIGRAMEKFKPLIEAGKVLEAEAELDRVLERLKKDVN